MRRQWGVLFAFLALGSCAQCGKPAQPDGGEVGGGAGRGDGGGAGGGGGADVDAGTDAGPRLVGCEVAAQAGAAPPECTPPTGTCRTAADCPSSGLCLQLGTGSVCTQACADAGACSAGWTCQLRWTGAGQQGFCVPERRTP